MNYIKHSAMVVAAASNGNPITSTATIVLFYALFNLFEAGIEKLIFGYRFEHLLDVAFGAAFISYAAYCVWACAVFNTQPQEAAR